jgi:hypothetical protein
LVLAVNRIQLPFKKYVFVLQLAQLMLVLFVILHELLQFVGGCFGFLLVQVQRELGMRMGVLGLIELMRVSYNIVGSIVMMGVVVRTHIFIFV